MHRPRTVELVALAACLSLFPAMSDPGVAAAPLTPRAAVALALDNHPLLDAAEGAHAAAAADRDLARSGYLPRLGLTEEYARSTNPVFVFASKLGQEIFGPADFAIESLNRPDPFTNATTRLSLEQNIWDAGRTGLGIRAAGLGLDAAGEERRRTRDEVAFGALRAFWNAALADQMLEVARRAEEAAEANRRLAADQVESGIAVPSDRMSAEVRLAEVRAMRIRARQGVDVARSALAVALGLPATRGFELAVPDVAPAAPGDGLEPVLAEALRSRPELAAFERRVGQARLGERIARSGRLPVVGAGARYEWNDPDVLGSTGSNWTVTVSVGLPLFDGLETRARLARARGERTRLEALRAALEHGIRLEVTAAWAERVGAAERLRVAASALDQGREALRIVGERYAEGMAVIVELLGAEAAFTRTEGIHVEAMRDMALADAALALATGRDVARWADSRAAQETLP